MNRKDKFERILLFFTVEQANRYLLDFERNELNRLERGGSRERSETSAFRDPAFSFFPQLQRWLGPAARQHLLLVLDQSINKMVAPLATIKLSNPDNARKALNGVNVCYLVYIRNQTENV
jgi:hypothetical protein